MEEADIPDEFGKPPPRIGSGKHGRVSGSQWRTFFTVYLVATLVPLWHNGSPRQQEMLNNFMDLVSFVNQVSARSVTPVEIQNTSVTLDRFLSVMMKLYPWAPFLPNHHASTHFPDFMFLWGPIFVSSTWIVERTNHMFQRMKTNMKSGA